MGAGQLATIWYRLANERVDLVDELRRPVTWYVYQINSTLDAGDTYVTKCSKTLYRDSPVSAVFWSLANRTIWKTTLIEHLFSTKIVILDFWIFKVPFFAHFHYWNFSRFFFFGTEFSEIKLKWKSNGSCLYCITI